MAMPVDPILEKTLKRFGLKAEDLEPDTRNLKYLSPDEKWEILSAFFDSNENKTNLFINKKDKIFNITFKNPEDARKFVQNPSDGLSRKAREFVKTMKNEDPKEYDIFFNLSVLYDETSSNKKPNLVIVRVV